MKSDKQNNTKSRKKKPAEPLDKAGKSAPGQTAPAGEKLSDKLGDTGSRILQMLTPAKKAEYYSNGRNDGHQTVIRIDPEQKAIILSSVAGGDHHKIRTETFGYKAALYDEDFFDFLGKVLADYGAKYPAAQNGTTVVILPDSTFQMDTVTLPNIARNKMDDSLDIIVADQHRKMATNVSTCVIQQNHQNSTLSVITISKSILSSLHATCAGCKMAPKAVTYASAAIVNSIAFLNARLQRASYILLHINEKDSNFIFVNRGKSVGVYPLPFGWSILSNTKLAAEDMLFDHSVAELLVINALEKARAKKLTTVQGDTTSLMGQALNEMGGEMMEGGMENAAPNDAADASQQDPSRVMAKKTARKLPKFMLRPDPETGEQYVYENFRIFVKWALNLYEQNKFLFANDVPTVYVEMPEEFLFLHNMINEESDENKLRFSKLSLTGVKPEIRENLVSYGGFINNPNNAASSFT